jgi:hypothetical protein
VWEQVMRRLWARGAAVAWAAWCAPAAGGLFWMSNVTGREASVRIVRQTYLQLNPMR